MNAEVSPPARNGLLARLGRSIASGAKRLNPTSRTDAYRPEKHYMRGAGPKSEFTPPTKAGGSSEST